MLELQTAKRLRLEMGQPLAVRGLSATAVGYWPEHWAGQVNGVSLPTNYLAMDLSAVSAACHSAVDGLIGADFFAGRVVQIDFAKGKIRLLESYSPGARAEVLPLQVEGARLRAPVEVAGLGKAWARLDTGCASPLHWVAAAGALDGGESSQEIGVGVSSTLIRQNSQTVLLGGLTVKNVLTGLHAEKLLAGESGLMGAGLLSRFASVTLDEPGGRLVLEGLAGPKLTSPKFAGEQR